MRRLFLCLTFAPQSANCECKILNVKLKIMNQIKTFRNETFGEIRTLISEKGETFFIGKDVAKMLGYTKSRNALAAHVDKEDKKDALIQGPLGGAQRMTIINESGLYALILSSKLPQAKTFKRWVTNEVLPQIRVTGGYIPTRNPRTGEQLTDEQVVELAGKIMARTIARTNLPADNCVTASDIAKILEIGVKELNSFLVDKGVQYWNGSCYKLTARYADCGYAEERLFLYYGLKGAKKQRSYMVWTPKGKDFIMNNLCGVKN